MMKKLLLGSTALVAGGLMAAPAMAADPIKIGVGGYYQFFVNAGQIEGSYALSQSGNAQPGGSGSSTQYKGLSFYQEGEIHFTGQSKLDNGTTVGLTVELEGWNTSTSTTSGAGSVRQIDEAFLFAFGDWGRVEFGSRDQASYRMYYGVPSAASVYTGPFQHNSAATWANLAVQAANPTLAGVTFLTIGGQMQDVNRINYFTPRFMGLQLGVGYAPKVNVASTFYGNNTGPGAVGGICGFNDATAVTACPTNDYSYQDFFDIGANYLNKFGDVTVAAYGAFMYASFVPGNQPLAGAANLVTGTNLSNWKQWVVGLQLGWNGFTLGGSYSYDNLGLGSNYYTGVDNDNRKWGAGIMYETGPWQMSFEWRGVYNNNGNGSGSICGIASGSNAVTACAVPAGNTMANNSAFGSNPATGALAFGGLSTNMLQAAANYALGPGIKVIGGANYYLSTGPSNLTAQSSWSLFLGMDLRF